MMELKLKQILEIDIIWASGTRCKKKKTTKTHTQQKRANGDQSRYQKYGIRIY